ncbi:MarR family winged helix-turn-helix transcriptional regulator [Clostridium oryzae]|uniref:HTH-type transcriptional regulator MhqR n=1 Tax=Clostridium oryzae TaxID=1450648 RepID=A0A1V4ISS2_9CLOT|nr:MarR family transcriptional regulator [Clostridium oryzae]OPJ63081.1 HTH-type transcriptional regulator MhqR [Clostridium oryzae]
MEDINKAIEIIRILKRLEKGVHKTMGHHFKELNLTAPQGMILGVLSHYGEMKISDLSKKMGLSNSTVSGIVDRLENEELIKRSRSQADRRVIYVSVTDKFRKTSEEHFKKMTDRFNNLITSASDEEIEAIINGLQTLEKLLQKGEL